MIQMIINGNAIEKVLENLNELIKAGKIRCIGLSNETPWGNNEVSRNCKKTKPTPNDVDTKCL